MKPLYDFYCGSNTWQEVKEVFKFLFSSNDIVEGLYIKKFEDEIGKVTNSKYVVSYNSGRHALYSILKALGIKQGDEVILQAFTCVVVPNAILYTGAIPVYMDVEKDHYTLSFTDLKRKITSRTKAVIVQHTFGYMTDIQKVRDIVGKDIFIIEDCAHTIKILQGDAGFISTDHTKVISTVIGGAFFTNSKIFKSAYYTNEKLSKFRVFQIAFTFMMEVIITYSKFYKIGRYIRWLLTKLRVFYFLRDENKSIKPKKYPVKMSNLQAFIGCMQMKKLNDNLKHRTKLSGCGIDLLRRPILVEDKEKAKSILKKEGMIAGVWFDLPVFGCDNLERVKYKNGSCPNAEYMCKYVINLPTHQRISSDDSKRIIKKLKEKYYE